MYIIKAPKRRVYYQHLPYKPHFFNSVIYEQARQICINKKNELKFQHTISRAILHTYQNLYIFGTVIYTKKNGIFINDNNFLDFLFH